MIIFPCPSCGQILRLKDEAAGRRGKCPKCQNVVVVPAAPSPVAASAPGIEATSVMALSVAQAAVNPAAPSSATGTSGMSPPGSSTSISLLERVRKPERDPAAWERFVRLYSPLLHFWAGKVGLGPEEAADAVQDVFVQLIHKLPEFQHDGRSFRGWLRTVLRNKCVDHLRRRQRGPTNADSNVLENLANADPVEILTEAEYSQYVTQQALRLVQAEFAEATWQAGWKTIVEEKSGKDVAEELGMSVNAVFIAKSRVLRRLREALKGLVE